MGYPIPSIGLYIYDRHYPCLYGHLGMQPILRHTMTHPMNMVTFCLSEVRSTILTLLSSHQLDVTDFFGTAPFEANLSQPKFSRNPTFGSKTPSRLRFVSESDGYRSGFWSILVIFNIDHPIIGVSNYIVTAKFHYQWVKSLFLMVNSLPITWGFLLLTSHGNPVTFY